MAEKRRFGHSRNAYLSYAQSTKVLGYGAIGGDPSNRGLLLATQIYCTKVSQNIEFGYGVERIKLEF